MRILLVGNYPLDRQLSMARYPVLLERQMLLRGHCAEVIYPQAVFGEMLEHSSARKWLGYVDKYLVFPLKLRRCAGSFDVVHVCDHSNSMYLAHVAGRPASITCHDLVAIASAQGSYRQASIGWMGRLQQRWIGKHLARARNIVCVSTNTAEELVERVRCEAQITVIPNALSLPTDATTPQTVQGVLGRLGLEGASYLFHVGGNHWYKNRDGVLRIFSLLREELVRAGAAPMKLVMAGAPFLQEMREFVERNKLGGEVLEVVGPSDEEIVALYRGASALLFPSLYEGFGWPIIEAQSFGCPVITSNCPPMTEVAGDSALLIDPADDASAAASIAANLDRLPSLREAGFRNISRFAPERIGEQYEAFFEDVVRCQSSGEVSGSKAMAHREL